jgi:hypothetical protein
MRTHARARARMYSEPYERSYLLAACGTDSQAGPRGRPGSEPESGVSPEPEIGRITRIPIARAPLPPPPPSLYAHTRDGRNSKDRSDKVALYRLGTRVTLLIIIVGLLLFHLACARSSTSRLFAFMSARTHARRHLCLQHVPPTRDDINARAQVCGEGRR